MKLDKMMKKLRGMNVQQETLNQVLRDTVKAEQAARNEVIAKHEAESCHSCDDDDDDDRHCGDKKVRIKSQHTFSVNSGNFEIIEQNG
jgi:hypothetical protein